jgi:hypothetical protein
MVRFRCRDNHLLYLPGISAEPRIYALAVTLVVTLRAHSEVHPPPRHRVRVVHLSVSYVRHSIVRPFLSPTCESLSYESFIYSPPSYVTRIVCLACRSCICLLCSSSCCASLSISYSYVICLARPFLSPTCESLCCASFVCLSCAHFCLVVHCGRRGEEWVSHSLASWEDKRMDVVASSWRYFSTQSIISDPPPTFSQTTFLPRHRSCRKQS